MNFISIFLANIMFYDGKPAFDPVNGAPEIRKLIDFGIMQNVGNFKTRYVQTCGYRAPEVSLGKIT